MKVVILSDIHGNMNALERVFDIIDLKRIDTAIILGDVIDYGMHSNEVIRLLQKCDLSILCNIWGNHEESIMNNQFSNFSSERGIECAKYTQSILDEVSRNYISNNMMSQGAMEFEIAGKKCLAVHGSLEDVYWKAIRPEQNFSEYSKYDYVFSGHSHLPHYYEVFFETRDEIHRNKKKTVFINPGSVGQPRNLCNLAQFAIWDTESEAVSLERVVYDIGEEQNAYHGQVNDFYKYRLETGV